MQSSIPRNLQTAYRGTSEKRWKKRSCQRLLTLDYSVADSGCGGASVTPRLDGMTMLHGHGLESGQAINLLTEVTTGDHTFTVDAVEQCGGRNTESVTFTIIVTPESIKDDVNEFLAMSHSQPGPGGVAARQVERGRSGACPRQLQFRGQQVRGLASSVGPACAQERGDGMSDPFYLRCCAPIARDGATGFLDGATGGRGESPSEFPGPRSVSATRMRSEEASLPSLCQTCSRLLLGTASAHRRTTSC